LRAQPAMFSLCLSGEGFFRLRPPRYIDLALRDAASRVVAEPIFVHLGHWDAPPGAAPSAGEFPAAQLRLTEVLLAMAGVGDGMSVLDVACGLGGTLTVLNARHRGMTLAGLDRDRRQLAVARRLAARQDNRVMWDCGDACQLPYPDRSFERVLCIEAMFHFASRRAFVANAARVLRPGGRLVFSDIVASDALRQAPAHRLPQVEVEAIIKNGMGPWPDLWGADADHDTLAVAAGFTPLQTVDATAATLPSHSCILGGPDVLGTLDSRGAFATSQVSPADPRSDQPPDPVRRASAMLAWLHRHGYVRVLYKSYQAR